MYNEYELESLDFIRDLKPEGKVAVMVSGGIDSRVLSTLLKKVHDDVTTINIPKPYAGGVDNYPEADRQWKLVESDDRVAWRMYLTFLEIKEEYDQLWTAENDHPFIGPLDTDDEIPPRCNGTRPHPWYYAPMMDYDKSFSVALAQYWDIDLSDTHSCTKQKDGHCKVCWFCKEREYGFAMNGLPTQW